MLSNTALSGSYALILKIMPLLNICFSQNNFLLQILFVLCERLLHLCNCRNLSSPYGIRYEVTDLPFTRSFVVARINTDQHTGFLHSCSASTGSPNDSPFASTC